MVVKEFNLTAPGCGIHLLGSLCLPANSSDSAQVSTFKSDKPGRKTKAG